MRIVHDYFAAEQEVFRSGTGTYIMPSSYIVRFCGLLGLVVEESTTETRNERKLQGANCGNRKDAKKALNSVNVTVLLLGDGNTLLLFSNFLLFF